MTATPNEMWLGLTRCTRMDSVYILLHTPDRPYPGIDRVVVRPTNYIGFDRLAPQQNATPNRRRSTIPALYPRAGAFISDLCNRVCGSCRSSAAADAGRPGATLGPCRRAGRRRAHRARWPPGGRRLAARSPCERRSEEHTSELQSLRHLVCR